MIRRSITGAVVITAAFAVAACGQSADTASAPDSATPSETTATQAAENSNDLSLEQPVVRAMEAGKGMTGVFGTLTNHTDEDINLTGFSTSLEGDVSYELHETVDGVMREVDGGFVIPAGGSVELIPGEAHLMIMGYDGEIAAGDTIDVTLIDSKGTTYAVPDVAVRTLLPGDENYGEDGDLQGHQPEHGTDMGHGNHSEH